MSPIHLKSRLLGGFFLLLTNSFALAQSAPTPLSFSGAALTQDFNSLSNSAAGSTLPSGFGFVEAGSNANTSYSVGDGSLATGDTYSFGASGSSDRALGGLQSGSVTPTFGVLIRNDSGAALTQFTVAYRGKQFRLGAARTGTADRLDVQLSTSATSLSDATGFVDIDALDFVSPVTTGSAGVVSASAPISATLSGYSVAPGATLALRFVDFNVSGADDALAIDDFSFSSGSGTGPNPTPTPIPGPASALISEYRLSGPNGGADEFIELYNNTANPLNVGGWSIAAGNVSIAIPGGTGSIPVKGHLLLTGSAYSLANYGGVGRAAGDVSYQGDITDGAALTLRNSAGVPIDTVSQTGLPAPAAGSQSSYVRRLESGAPMDSGVDSDDFNLVEVNAASAGPNSTSGVTSGVLRLGAPSPENLSSPLKRTLVFGLIDPGEGANTGINGVRTGSGNGGTLLLRRTLTNKTGVTLNRLRIRLVAMTAGTPNGSNPGAVADIRLIDSASSVQVNGMDVSSLTVETLPGQNSDSGGALNCSLNITLPAGGIPDSSTVTIELLFRIVKSGTFRTLYHFEGSSEPDVPTSNRPDDDNLLLGNPSQATTLNAQGSNKENLLHEHTAWSLAYQKSMGGPRWVSWHLDTDDIGSSGRNSSFPNDSDLPADCQISESDYNNSGYTRGHQCPSGDRTASDALNRETFLMSNMLPQTASLNNGVWSNLEEYCRNQARAGNELYILSGGVGSNGRIAGNKVNAPASCWKIIVILPKGTNDLARINNSTRVMSVLIPNSSTVNGTYNNYLTTVDNIESLTGLDFLSNLPDSIENFVEARASN